MHSASERLIALGFAPADRADLGDGLAHVTYLYRAAYGHHQYVSLLPSEAVYEVYEQPKGRKAKPPAFATIYRTPEELFAAVETPLVRVKLVSGPKLISISGWRCPTFEPYLTPLLTWGMRLKQATTL